MLHAAAAMYGMKVNNEFDFSSAFNTFHTFYKLPQLPVSTKKYHFNKRLLESVRNISHSKNPAKALLINGLCKRTCRTLQNTSAADC